MIIIRIEFKFKWVLLKQMHKVPSLANNLVVYVFINEEWGRKIELFSIINIVMNQRGILKSQFK